MQGLIDQSKIANQPAAPQHRHKAHIGKDCVWRQVGASAGDDGEVGDVVTQTIQSNGGGQALKGARFVVPNGHKACDEIKDVARPRRCRRCIDVAAQHIVLLRRRCHREIGGETLKRHERGCSGRVGSGAQIVDHHPGGFAP